MSAAPKKASVYSNKRTLKAPKAEDAFVVGKAPLLDAPNKMDGLKGLGLIKDDAIAAAFFDPQYRGVMDKMSYGNEGARQKERAQLQQMPAEQILKFIAQLERVLIPSGHLFLWIDKFHLCEGVAPWFEGTQLEIVDLVTWEKGRIGMGYRTRRKSEYLLVLQKSPRRAKGAWMRHDIPDVWQEKIERDAKSHTHTKPIGLQTALIEAVTKKGDLVLDPASGSYSVMKAALACGRHFVGFDLRQP